MTDTAPHPAPRQSRLQLRRPAEIAWAFVLGPTNKTATLKILQRRLRVSEKEAEEGFVDIALGMDKKPYPSMDGLRNIQRLMKIRNPKLGELKVETIIDGRIMRRLEETGFIDATYAAQGLK